MEAFLSSPWGIPLLSLVALAGGYAHLLRAAHRRIELLEDRCDKHVELEGHPVSIARIASLESQHAQVLAALQNMQASIATLQQQTAEIVGELRAARRSQSRETH